MDPLTAAFNALAALNQFLVTPAGQKFATDFETVMAGLLNDLHIHIASNQPATTIPTTPKG